MLNTMENLEIKNYKPWSYWNLMKNWVNNNRSSSDCILCLAELFS